MWVFNFVLTLFPLIPLWLILKDNNVELGFVPFFMIGLFLVFIGVLLCALDNRRADALKSTIGGNNNCSFI